MVSRQSENYLVQIVGKAKEFETLQDLVQYYSKVPTSSAEGVCLVKACAKGDESDDENETPGSHYVELEEQAVLGPLFSTLLAGVSEQQPVVSFPG
eukprot:m.28447 g.28447  ORF g.28447 m.28447 type:complete len:96 (-) comp40164_c0_seq4:307-594(-)